MSGNAAKLLKDSTRSVESMRFCVDFQNTIVNIRPGALSIFGHSLKRFMDLQTELTQYWITD